MGETSGKERRLLDEHHWEDTIPRLLSYAQNKIQRRKWMGKFGGDPPEGWQAEDVVQTVIEKVFSGIRYWDPEKHPVLFDFLRSQVDSEISNRVRSLANKKLRTESVLPEGNFQPVDKSTLDESLMAKEQEKEADILFWGFYDHLSDEPELQKVVEAIADGKKRADMAQHLGVKVEVIDALKKRLGRRLKEFHASRTAPAIQEGGTARA